MKIYKTQSEVEKDIKNGVLVIDDDVTFECSISIDASINARDINAINIDANNIYAYNIKAHNIDACNIDANNIKAHNIDAWDINAMDINADNISYYAFCFSYNSIKCYSIKARRENHSEPICLDGKLEIKEQEDNVALEAIKLLEEKGYKIVKN
jgi:hypothetical protein